jgi:hypothetical protein
MHEYACTTSSDTGVRGQSFRPSISTLTGPFPLARYAVGRIAFVYTQNTPQPLPTNVIPACLICQNRFLAIHQIALAQVYLSTGPLRGRLAVLVGGWGGREAHRSAKSHQLLNHASLVSICAPHPPLCPHTQARSTAGWWWWGWVGGWVGGGGGVEQDPAAAQKDGKCVLWRRMWTVLPNTACDRVSRGHESQVQASLPIGQSLSRGVQAPHCWHYQQKTSGNRSGA